MSDPMHIRAGEARVIRLFVLNMRPEQARFLQEPGAVEQVLGVSGLDPEQIEVFPVSDLEDLGLYGYLTEGCGVPAEQLDKASLDATQGWVLLVRSKAFGGNEATLSPNTGVELIGIYTEDGTDWSSTPIQAESAKPYSAPRPSPRQARAEARRIGFTLFVIVMSLIIGGILWIAL